MSFTRVIVVGLSLAALAGGVAYAEERAPGGGARVAGVTPGVVDGPTARKLVASGIKVVDVRTPAEFTAGHVPGAMNIPYDEMARRHAEIGNPSTPVLLYCRSGHRSGIAAQTLRREGFSTLYDMQAYERWAASEPQR